MTIRVFDYALRAIIFIILIQTLWFKFRAAPESVQIFTLLHAEPWGRIATGAMELVASLLLLSSRTVIFGAGMALVAMFGAIIAHTFLLGIVIADDAGMLFALACFVALAALLLLFLHRSEVMTLLRRLRRSI